MLAGCQGHRELNPKILGKMWIQKQSSLLSEMEVAKPSAPPDLAVRFGSCNKSAIKRWLSLELEEQWSH